MPGRLLGRRTDSTLGLAGLTGGLDQSSGDFGEEEDQDFECGEASSYKEVQDCPPSYAEVVGAEESYFQVEKESH